MVFIDISAPEKETDFNAKHKRIAPVSDRVLALVIDFLIFSPVVGLFVAGLQKQAKTIFLVERSSTEIFISWLLLMVATVFVSSLLQAVFLYFWKATPGQKFVHLEIASIYSNEQLTFSQCFLRSLLWWFCLSLFAVPFLEVLSHPLRRALHERATDTIIITHHSKRDEGPLALESKFIASWINMFFLSGLAIAIIFVMQTSERLRKGEYALRDGAGTMAKCAEVSSSVNEPVKRVDYALTMFAAGFVGKECVEREAKYLLWLGEEEKKGLGYFAYSLLTTDKEEKKKYLTQACNTGSKEVCSLVELQETKAPQKAAKLRQSGLRLAYTRMLLVEEAIKYGEIMSALVIVDDLRKELDLQPIVEKAYVRSVWSLINPSSKNSRTPASSETNKVIKEFKERYSLQ